MGGLFVVKFREISCEQHFEKRTFPQNLKDVAPPAASSHKGPFCADVWWRRYNRPSRQSSIILVSRFGGGGGLSFWLNSISSWTKLAYSSGITLANSL